MSSDETLRQKYATSVEKWTKDLTSKAVDEVRRLAIAEGCAICDVSNGVTFAKSALIDSIVQTRIYTEMEKADIDDEDAEYKYANEERAPRSCDVLDDADKAPKS